MHQQKQMQKQVNSDIDRPSTSTSSSASTNVKHNGQEDRAKQVCMHAPDILYILDFSNVC